MRSRASVVAIHFLIFFSFLPTNLHGQLVDALTQLHLDVFNKYVPVVPLCYTSPVSVNFSWTLFALIELSDVDEVIQLTSAYTMKWYDCGLRWNSSNYNGIQRSEYINPSGLWTPDLTWMERIPFVDAFQFNDGLFSGVRPYIYSDGTVVMSRELVMKSYCPLGVMYFPFDTQICNLSFFAWSYSTEWVELNGNLGSFDASSSDSWTILGIPVLNLNVSDHLSKEEFSTVRYQVMLARRPMFYLFYMMLPFFIISLLNCFTFLIPPEAQEKVVYTLSVLLSLAVYMTLMIKVTPQKAEIPIISAYFFTGFILSIFSATLAVLLEIYYTYHFIYEPPLYLKRVFADYLGKFRFFRLTNTVEHKHTHKNNSVKNVQLQPQSHADSMTHFFDREQASGAKKAEIERASRLHVCEWRQISYAIDRVLFLIYTIASTVVFFTLFAVSLNSQLNFTAS